MKNKMSSIMPAVVFSLASGIASAELKPLDDKELSEIEGQAGITIDLEVQLEIGEMMWKDGDGGSLVVQGMRLGGNGMKKKKIF